MGPGYVVLVAVVSWYGLPLTEGVADTNMLTPMRDVVDHSFQNCILQAEGVEYLEETGVPDSVKIFREIKKTIA